MRTKAPNRQPLTAVGRSGKREGVTCRILALTLACSVVAGIAAEKESTDDLTAHEILERMATTYATCKSYHDSGVVTNFFNADHTDVKPFRTAFVRPDQFRFEYDDPTPDKAYIVWANAREVRKWWYVEPGVQKPPSLARGIAGATGVSGGSAHTIPTLLLSDEIEGRKLTEMTDLTRLPDEVMDGSPCFRLQGKFANEPTTLWLEKTTYLIRRIAEETDLARETTVYSPEVNKEIAAEELKFSPPNVNTRPNSLALSSIGGGEIVLILVLLFILAVLAVGFLGLIYLIVRAVLNRPPPVPSMLPPEVVGRRDREHMKLLAIFHFVFGGLAFVGMCFLCVHYAIMHTVFANPDMWKSQPQALPPKAFLDAFVWFYLFMGVILLTGLVLNVLSGFFLWQKRNRIFSLIIAGVDCIQIPFGTTLGVFTILVLSRDSVRQLYSESGVAAPLVGLS
jgi:outer membrane lipoprotein-sorting protein